MKYYKINRMFKKELYNFIISSKKYTYIFILLSLNKTILSNE